ncbi:MAG TPA: hypothetical protein VME20_13070 [Acidimicrobiales bacterium]|nr:hypothetical protein [Acidimicrobiales bacterium]
MGAALALAIMLVVVVGILSLAVNAQGPFQGGTATGRVPRPTRSSHPGGGPTVTASERPPRRPPRERNERKDRQVGQPAPPPQREPDQVVEPDQSFTDLKPLSGQAQALVISVVDERTLGPVTRSRLTLRVEPPQGDAFEVTTRVAFPTPEERARIKVGALIPVRYDENDHRRVVVDMEKDGGG